MNVKTNILIGALGMVLSGMASAAPIYWTDWTGSDLDAGTGFQG